MRKIGELPSEREAQLFHDALFVHGIENDVESDEGGTYSIWVHDDDQREKAAALLEKFRKSPDAPDWQDAAKADKLRKQAEREEARRASNVITRERMEYERNFTGFASLPFILAVLSVLATLFAGELDPINLDGVVGTHADREYRRNEIFSIARSGLSPADQARLEFLHQRLESDKVTISEVNEFTALLDKRKRPTRSLKEVRSGQIWRIFTPILIHFSIIHIIFNILWLRDLGSIVQIRFGAGYSSRLSFRRRLSATSRRWRGVAQLSAASPG